MAEIPHKERLPSQIFAEYGRRWVALDGAASLLEEGKKTFFNQLKLQEIENNPKLSQAAAETNASVRPEYIGYFNKMVDARIKANEARIGMKYAEIRAQERNSEEAAMRQERRMMGVNG
jgi:hypothetical protein